MPEPTIDFTVSVPIRVLNAADVRNAFIAKFGYQEALLDEQNNPYPNPITPEMFVEDCVAQYILRVTANHLIDRTIMGAIDTAITDTKSYIDNMSDWYDQNT